MLICEVTQSRNIMYHVTPTKNLRQIGQQGLVPSIGDRSSQISGEVNGIFVFPNKESAEDATMNWLGDQFDEDEALALLAVDVTGLEAHIKPGALYERIITTTVDPQRLKVVTKNF